MSAFTPAVKWSGEDIEGKGIHTSKNRKGKGMRKVIARIYDHESKKWIDGIPGKFHQWGNACEEFHDGPGNYTIAIIERPGGRIVTALPEDVKFMS